MEEIERQGDQPVAFAVEVLPAADGVALVSVSGELDSANADALADALRPIIANGTERLVLELGDLRFMDSAGIAVLVNAARVLKTVELRNPSAIVRRLIEATGLTSIFELAP